MGSHTVYNRWYIKSHMLADIKRRKSQINTLKYITQCAKYWRWNILYVSYTVTWWYKHVHFKMAGISQNHSILTWWWLFTAETCCQNSKILSICRYIYYIYICCVFRRYKILLQHNVMAPIKIWVVLFSSYLLYYTGCFTTLGHNCRRWFPRSLWWKKFI